MPKMHDGCSSPAGLTRRLLARSICASWLLLVLSMAMIWYAGQRTFYNEIVPEFRGQSRAVGSDLAAQIERAVDFGIPVNALIGVPALFEEFLKNHPRLAYVALDDSRGGLLFSAHQPGAARDIDPGRDVAIPIDIGGRLIGTLHVGVRTLHRREFLRLDLWHGLMLLVIGSAAMACALAVVIRRSVLTPLSLMKIVCAAFGRGSWNVQAREVGAPETRAALMALNGAFDQIAEQRRRTDWLAGEVVACGTQRIKSIETLLGTLPSVRPAEVRVLAPAEGVVSPAFLFFLVCLADQLVAWWVPLGGQIRTPLGMVAAEMPLGVRPVELWPTAAGLAGLVAGALLGGTVARLRRPGLLLATGALLVAAGESLFLVRTGGMMLVSGRALASFGIAVLAIVCGCRTRAGFPGKPAQGSLSKRPIHAAKSARSANYFSLRPGTRLGKRDSALLTAAASSVLVGAAAGPLLAEQFGAAACFIVAMLISLLAAPLALNLEFPPGGWPGKLGRARHVMAPLAVLAGMNFVALAVAGLLGRGSAMAVSLAVAGYGLVILGLIHRPRFAATRRPRPR